MLKYIHPEYTSEVAQVSFHWWLSKSVKWYRNNGNPWKLHVISDTSSLPSNFKKDWRVKPLTNGFVTVVEILAFLIDIHVCPLVFIYKKPQETTYYTSHKSIACSFTKALARQWVFSYSLVIAWSSPGFSLLPDTVLVESGCQNPGLFQTCPHLVTVAFCCVFLGRKTSHYHVLVHEDS